MSKAIFTMAILLGASVCAQAACLFGSCRTTNLDDVPVIEFRCGGSTTFDSCGYSSGGTGWCHSGGNGYSCMFWSEGVLIEQNYYCNQ